MGKGDDRRPMQISHDEYELRWAFMLGYVTIEEFYKKKKELENDVRRHR